MRDVQMIPKIQKCFAIRIIENGSKEIVLEDIFIKKILPIRKNCIHNKKRNENFYFPLADDTSCLPTPIPVKFR